jgi:transposase InsO family protein
MAVLKQAFITAPILAHFDPNRECLVETDASDYVSAGILSQRDDDGVLHPVAYFSKKHSPAECNYEIYDKELMAIVRCFEEWRAELEGSSHVIEVLSDHKNLEYFMSTKLLSRRQARWSEFLSRFNFRISYRTGRLSTKPDALTRRSKDLPNDDDERKEHMHQVVLKPHNVLKAAATNEREPVTNIDELWEQGHERDTTTTEILTALRTNATRSRHVTLSQCSERNGILLYQDRIYVPDFMPLKLKLIKDHHETPAAGHPGRAKTLELLARTYFWPKMRKEVDRFVRNCHACQRSRTSRHAPFGILKPLSVPEGAWRDVSMDFVTGLPWSNGFNAILNVTCRLTKMRHLIPCRDNTTAEQLAELYIRYVFRLHGLPDTILSDRGPQFVSHFWKALCKTLKVQVALSTPYHAATDGQTERFNAVMEQFLRVSVNYLQDDWEKWLPLAEFAANNQDSETTGVSPFFANYGYDPRWQCDPLQLANVQRKEELDARTAATRLKEIHDHLKVEMAHAQARHREYANEHRTPAPIFKEGDEVWLNAKNVATERPSKKLDHRRIGPFKILKVVSDWAYELDFPRDIKMHPVQHVSLLSPTANDPLSGQRNPPPPPVVINDEEEYVVDEILDARIRWNRLEYLVKWIGYDNPSWHRAKDINGLQAIDRFHELYPDKPGPLPEDLD